VANPSKSPTYVRADSCGPQGAEPICPGASSQPVRAIPVFTQEEPPVGDVAKEGLLAVPINPGDHAELAYVDERGGGTRGSRLRSRVRWATTHCIQFV
jgi:hypothetical protein